jgi:hypothetical protein
MYVSVLVKRVTVITYIPHPGPVYIITPPPISRSSASATFHFGHFLAVGLARSRCSRPIRRMTLYFSLC